MVVNKSDQSLGIADPDFGSFDVIVAGAGIGGVSASLAAARTGARVLLVEADEEIGGTGVHSPVALVCTFRDHNDRPINAGLHREYFPTLYDNPSPPDKNPAQEWYGTRLECYDHRELLQSYQRLIAAEPNLTVRTGRRVSAVHQIDGEIQAVCLEGTQAGWVKAKVFVDSTADGNLSALAGAEFQLGRESDRALQPSTLTFGMTNINFGGKPPTTWPEMDAFNRELTRYLHAAIAAGEVHVLKKEIFGIPYPDGRGLQFNTTRMLGVDPTRPETVAAARKEGERQVNEIIGVLRQHPAFAEAKLDFVGTKLGVREGRRIMGDYVLTAEDCLRPARFDDMVAACAYMLDIHNPTGSGTHIEQIPAPGYYHIPYRCLIARGHTNLLLGSRCISGTHEAHSSYRVMGPLSAIGQAAGVAAALTALGPKSNVRAIPASAIRWVLREQGQFVEGSCEKSNSH
jgi:hypothetical protein